MEQPEQNVAARTEMPKPAALQDTGRREFAAPSGQTIFDLRNVSIWYSSFKAVTDVTLNIHENEITAFIARPGAASRRCCGRSTG